MIGPADFFFGGVLPAIIAAGALVGSWKLSHNATVSWLVGMTMGYLVGHWALDAQGVGWPASVVKSFQPHEARDWLPLAVLLAVVTEVLAHFGKRGGALAWWLRLVLCVLLPWRLLYGSAYLPATVLPNAGFNTGAWSRGEAIGWLGGIGAALFAFWLVVGGWGEKTLPWLRSLLATFVALGGAATLAMSGSLSYGQLIGVLAATLVGCGVVSALLRLDVGPEAAAGPLLVVFGGVLVLACFFAELKLHNAILLLLAICAATGWLVGGQRLSPRVAATFRCALCLTVLSAAVGLAATDFATSQAEVPSNPYLDFQP